MQTGHAGVVFTMVAQAQPDTDDDPGHYRFIQNDSGGYVRDGNSVLIRNTLAFSSS